jgi:NAD(P)-dependent dehydrogenase (short-subunit alcohol dehydrogenase family)
VTSVTGLIDEIFKTFGRLRVLVNNAGTDVTKPIMEMSVKE